MLDRIRSHVANNVVGYLALFVALGGTSAYAANTVFSSDIVDGEVKTPDLAVDAVRQPNVRDGAIGRNELLNGAVIREKLNNSAVDSGKVADDSLTGADIANGQVQAGDLAPGVSGARAWGLVNAIGDLIRSKNIVRVDYEGSGVFCIFPAPGLGIDPSTAVMVVGDAFRFTSDLNDNVAHVEWDPAAPVCPNGTMEVRTFLGNGRAPSNGQTDVGGFNVFESGEPFSFVIP